MLLVQGIITFFLGMAMAHRLVEIAIGTERFSKWNPEVSRHIFMFVIYIIVLCLVAQF